MPDMLGGHAGPRMGRKTSGGRAVTNGYMGEVSAEAAGVIAAARAAGVQRIYLAGPAKAIPDEADAEAKPDDYLTMTIDAVQVLSDLLTRLGA